MWPGNLVTDDVVFYGMMVFMVLGLVIVASWISEGVRQRRARQAVSDTIFSETRRYNPNACPGGSASCMVWPARAAFPVGSTCGVCKATLNPMPSAELQGSEPVVVDITKMPPRDENGRFQRVPTLAQVLSASNYRKGADHDD